LLAAEADALTSVHLPDLMRGLGARPSLAGPSPGCGWLQIGTKDMALQRPRAGQGRRAGLFQDDAKVGSAPGGMLAALLDGLLTNLWLATAAVVCRSAAVGLEAFALGEQAADRTREKPQTIRDV
jgi:hypothetical protein